MLRKFHLELLRPEYGHWKCFQSIGDEKKDMNYYLVKEEGLETFLETLWKRQKTFDSET